MGMDPLSVTASIVAIVQLSTKALGYLDYVKDASKDRTRWTTEILNLCNLLYRLRDRVEEGYLDKSWFADVQALAVKGGPFDQFKQALETLHAKIADSGRINRAGEVLMWKSKKEEVASILGQIERVKTLIEFALQMDHL